MRGVGEDVGPLPEAHEHEELQRRERFEHRHLVGHGIGQHTPIAHVEGVFNAVVAETDFAETNVFEGRGAGAGPTASAIVADLMDIARDRILPAFSAPAETLELARQAPVGLHAGSYYLRLMVVDKPGVIADIAGVMRDESVSMEAMIQRARSPGEAVPIVLTTHETTEAAIGRVVARLAQVNSILEPAHVLPIETLS